MELREQRDLVEKLIASTVEGGRPVSATYTAQVNSELLTLARDGLRFRLMREAATEGPEAIPDSFVGEIDRRLAAL